MYFSFSPSSSTSGNPFRFGKGASSGFFRLSVWILTYMCNKFIKAKIIRYVLSLHFQLQLLLLDMTFMFTSEDKITLDKITQFVDSKSLDKFVFFINEVELTKEDKSEYVLDKVKSCFDYIFKVHAVKALLPIRSLLLRMLDSTWGFNELHTYFIKVCLVFELPREALPIMQHTGLFLRTMSRGKIATFLFYVAETYIKLMDYRLAHETIKRFFTQGYIQAPELIISTKSQIFYLHIVLAISQGEARLSKVVDLMKMHADMIEQDVERLALGQSGFKIDAAKELRGFKLFFPLKEWRKLNEEETKVMKEFSLTEIYKAGEWKSLGRYINNELKSNNWRMKSSSVKGINLKEWQVTQGANYQDEVYRFDTKDSILYFNHKKATQQTLNNIITKTYNMQREAAECKIERSEGLGQTDMIGGLMRAASGGRHNKRSAQSMGLGPLTGTGYGNRQLGDYLMENDDDFA